LFFICDLVSVIYPATRQMVLDYLDEISPSIAASEISVPTLLGLAVAMNLLRPVSVTSEDHTDTY